MHPHDTFLRHNLTKRFVGGMWLMTVRRQAAHILVGLVAGLVAGNLFARFAGAWTMGTAMWAVVVGGLVSWALLTPFYEKETYHHPVGFQFWSWWQGVNAPRPPKPGRAVFATRIDTSKVRVAGMRKQP